MRANIAALELSWATAQPEADIDSWDYESPLISTTPNPPGLVENARHASLLLGTFPPPRHLPSRRAPPGSRRCHPRSEGVNHHGAHGGS